MLPGRSPPPSAIRREFLSLKVLQELRSWNLSPFDLKSVGHSITEQFSDKLLRIGLLPEGEFNDRLILAETAVANIPALVPSDADMLDMDEKQTGRGVCRGRLASPN